jgi:hypothetical protein
MAPDPGEDDTMAKPKKNDDKPPPSKPKLPPGQLSDGRHWKRILNADGTQSTTSVPCDCSATGEHT